MAILSYATPPAKPPVFATVLLSLWAFLDVVYGVVVALAGLVAISGSNQDGGLFGCGLMIFVSGLALLAWGIYAGRLATDVFHQRSRAADRALRATRLAAAVWMLLNLFAAGLVLLCAAVYDKDLIGLLVPVGMQIFVPFVPIHITLRVLRTACYDQALRATIP